MKVMIGDKTIRLVPSDVKLAKRLVRNFLATAKEKADVRGVKTFYYTLLVVMYVMANDLIESVTPEVLSVILNHRADNVEDI